MEEETDPRYISAVQRLVDRPSDPSTCLGTWVAQAAARGGESRETTLAAVEYIFTGRGTCPVGFTPVPSAASTPNPNPNPNPKALSAAEFGVLDMSGFTELDGLETPDEEE